MNLRTRAVLLAATVALAIGSVTATASASTALSPGVWTPFFWGGGNGAVPTESPFTFTSAGPAVVTVTDVFCVGDRFTLTDTNVLGTTSLPDIAPTCMYPGTGDPAAALADPNYSHGAFAVASGSHSIGVVVSTSPFGAGAAFIRVDAMSKEMCKSGGWARFGGETRQFKNQGDCMSFVATGYRRRHRDESTGRHSREASYGRLPRTASSCYSSIPTPQPCPNWPFPQQSGRFPLAIPRL